MFGMSPLLVAVALSVQPARDAPPTEAQVRQSVERSLAFLEKSGAKWWTGNKCASCHHVPISVWSMSEAKSRGFKVDEKSLEQMRDGALASYANHAKLRPVGQDGDKGLSMNTMYLTVAAAAVQEPDEKTRAAVEKFAEHFLECQERDGSWQSSAKLPPVGDVTEVRTMQVLLALELAHKMKLIDDARWHPAKEKALGWLAKHKFLDQNQSLNYRILVARRFGKESDMAALVKELLAQQEADGGWSQTRGAAKGPVEDYDGKEIEGKAKGEIRPSDAMATGQSLYALALAGVKHDQPAIQRAQAFLVRTQAKDGSWRVPIRSQKNSGTALSHYGTGWAALGLMQSLEPAVENKK